MHEDSKTDSDWSEGKQCKLEHEKWKQESS